MPLVWAHSEHIKLLRSLADGAVFDMPPQTVRRYQGSKQAARIMPWRVDFQSSRVPAGRVLRVELAQQSVVLWSDDAWATSREVPTADSGLGIHIVEIDTARRPVIFTWRSAATGAWAGTDYSVG